MRIFRKSLIFIIINILCFEIFRFLLAQPSMIVILFNSLHNKEGGYQTVVIGQSHNETSVNPFILSDDYNKSFNISRRLNPPCNFYYMVKESNKNSSLKKVICEIDSSYWNNQDISKGVDANLLYSLSNFQLKIDYIKNMFLDKDITDIFDYSFNKLSIKNSIKNIKAKLSDEYLNREEIAIPKINEALELGKNYKYIGRGFRYGLKFDKDIPYEFKDFSRKEISNEAIESFDKLQEYCNDNDIELICMISALPPIRLEKENHDEEHDYFQKFCDERNVKFYDMNYVKAEYLGRKNEDYVDLDGHMQGPLADKQTQVLKEILESEHPEEYFETSYEDVLNGLKEYENK